MCSNMQRGLGISEGRVFFETPDAHLLCLDARTGEVEGFTLDVTDHGEAPISLRLALEQARNAAATPERLVVRVAAGAVPPELEKWSAMLGIPVEPGPEWHWASAPQHSGLNLLQAEFAPRAIESGWMRTLRRPAFLAGVLVIVTLTGIAMDWMMKIRERNMVAARMQQIFRNAFGDSAVVVDAPLQMRRALAQLRRQTGQMGADDFLALLGPVAAQLLDPARIRVDGVVYGNGALTLTVRPQDASKFSALLAEMRAKSSIPGFDIRLEPADSAGTISLRVAPGSGSEK